MQNKLNKFLNKENTPIIQNKFEQDEEIIHSKSGLIERVDKKLVTKEGKQLLLEDRG
jgi:hypothetical protein